MTTVGARPLEDSLGDAVAMPLGSAGHVALDPSEVGAGQLPLERVDLGPTVFVVREQASEDAGQRGVGDQRPVQALGDVLSARSACQAVELPGQRAMSGHAGQDRFVEGDAGVPEGASSNGRGEARCGPHQVECQLEPGKGHIGAGVGGPETVSVVVRLVSPSG